MYQPQPNHPSPPMALPPHAHVHQVLCVCPYPHINPIWNPIGPHMPFMTPPTCNYQQMRPMYNNGAQPPFQAEPNFHRPTCGLPNDPHPSRNAGKPSKFPDIEVSAVDADTDNFLKFLEIGCHEAEQIAIRNEDDPCFTNIPSLCKRTKGVLSTPWNTLVKVKAQGVSWMIKDLIYSYMHLINSWRIVRCYVQITQESLGAVMREFTPDFHQCYAVWESTSKCLASHLLRICTNLDVKSGAAGSNKMRNPNQTGQLINCYLPFGPRPNPFQLFPFPKDEGKRGPEMMHCKRSEAEFKKSNAANVDSKNEWQYDPRMFPELDGRGKGKAKVNPNRGKPEVKCGNAPRNKSIWTYEQNTAEEMERRLKNKPQDKAYWNAQNMNYTMAQGEYTPYFLPIVGTNEPNTRPPKCSINIDLTNPENFTNPRILHECFQQIFNSPHTDVRNIKALNDFCEAMDKSVQRTFNEILFDGKDMSAETFGKKH